ncbi:hypothetical protein [Streptococcus saliviloxodontae]|uniref:YolD-like protein n=1 Tax=Streptococcus saliviloxodontae TaxID=1349416 RepID=A0ABS2PLP9_9STRE|nr:hypothetical protein [Streptococcus saliviloxodontae]MBM7636369.1 hypothetical protein [Streptococcus saliviloxodontae]
MKNIWLTLKHEIKQFFNTSQKAAPVNIKQNQVIKALQDALHQQAAIHVIYHQKSFTGNIIRYDKSAGKVILKNIQNNLSAIISLTDIDRITLIPETISKSQSQK